MFSRRLSGKNAFDTGHGYFLVSAVIAEPVVERRSNVLLHGLPLSASAPPLRTLDPVLRDVINVHDLDALVRDMINSDIGRGGE
jgi:hypothetical protein